MSIIQKAVQTQSERRAEAQTAGVGATGQSTAPARPVIQRPSTVAAFAPLLASGFLQIESGDPVSRSELRHLKRSVLQCALGPVADARANVVMITSPLPGAGKTFLSANLAMALAMEKDRSTLLIDADDTRATISRALGLHGLPGFFDVLQDPSLPLDACIHPSDVPGLEFVPAGRRFDDSLELLTSNRARDLVHRLADENRDRLIVLDCPPLLGTPNAGAISAIVGQILVAVVAGETSRESISQALELLNRDKPIGLVLNKIPRARLMSMSHGGYYSYDVSAED
ncbi:MAG: protein tyrosine kinase [Gammaproteobacteria bacterium]|nr:protein tyrosine kinase [Gammaproteobacteria bacterium]